jgi:hypothetical protein
VLVSRLRPDVHGGDRHATGEFGAGALTHREMSPAGMYLGGTRLPCQSEDNSA